MIWLILALSLLSPCLCFSTDLQAGTCQIETVCRSPKIAEDYKYNGIVRSGYLKIDGKPGSALGFLFFGKIGVLEPAQLKNSPTVVVLGGGPGMSSQFANLRELGPLNLRKVFAPTIQDNKYTWAKEANLLFVDQPVGTGVSCLANKTHLAANMDQISKDFYKAFYQLFTEEGNGCFNSKNLGIPPSSSLYLFGEGYGGKFAAAIGAKLQAEKKNGGIITGLKGVVIGGGLIAPYKIMSELGNYAFSMSLVDYQERIRVEKMLLKGSIDYEQKQWSRLREDFTRALNFVHQRSGVNFYDITKDGQYEDLVQAFFANKTNLQRFGFEKSLTFQTQTEAVYEKLAADFMQSEVYNVEYLLEEGIPVLVFQGQDDCYVNTPGTMKWVEELNYSGATAFRGLNLQAWKVNDVRYGSRKAAGRLTFIVVNNAGHFVSQDNPEASLYLLREFLKPSV